MASIISIFGLSGVRALRIGVAPVQSDHYFHDYFFSSFLPLSPKRVYATVLKFAVKIRQILQIRSVFLYFWVSIRSVFSCFWVSIWVSIMTKQRSVFFSRPVVTLADIHSFERADIDIFG